MAQGPLKIRADGLVNISLDPEAVSDLDAIGVELRRTLGFKLSRSQTLRHIVKKWREQNAEH